MSPCEKHSVSMLTRTLRVATVALAIMLLLGPSRSHAAQAPVDTLARQLSALSPGVAPAEARRLAVAAHAASAELATRYRPVGPPQLHNFLVNAGVKPRGLCHHWARDLGNGLAQLKLRTLVLRWGIARPGTLREHNAVVVTARGQRFHEGVVLDAWRRSGRLFFGAVATDKYPWQEDATESFAPSPRRATPQRHKQGRNASRGS